MEDINLLIKKSEEGDIEETFKLAKIYLSNKSPYKDEKKGIELLTVLANKNHLASLKTLGFYYYNKNETEKYVYYFKKAALLHDLVSINNVGVFYLNGEGVNKDLEIAKKCFLEASKDNDPMALTNLGRTYYKLKEYKNAYQCFLIASEKGYELAKELKIEMEKRLSKEEYLS